MNSQTAKYSVDDRVRFVDDPDVGVVTQVWSSTSGEYYYRVKFASTVDQKWPGFVYPEHLILPASNSEAGPEGSPQAGSGA